MDEKGVKELKKINWQLPNPNPPAIKQIYILYPAPSIIYKDEQFFWG